MPSTEEPREKKPRSVRVDPELWTRFKKACEANYSNRSEKLNQFMHKYTLQQEMKQGFLPEELRHTIVDELEKAIKKQSVEILQNIMSNFLEDGVTEEDVGLATDPDAVSDILNM